MASSYVLNSNINGNNLCGFRTLINSETTVDFFLVRFLEMVLVSKHSTINISSTNFNHYVMTRIRI